MGRRCMPEYASKKKGVHTADSFELKKSPGRGKGLFAKVRIKKGETIGLLHRRDHSRLAREPETPSLIALSDVGVQKSLD